MNVTDTVPALGAPAPPVSKVAAAVLGVAFHVATQGVELHYYAWGLVAAWNVAIVSAIVASVQIWHLSLTAAVVEVLPVAFSFLAALVGSIFVKRMFLSPLRKFPGPWQARLSKFYAMYLETKDFQLFAETTKLHEKYGDFVRTGPRDLSVLRPSAIPLLYGPKVKCKKPEFYHGNQYNDEDNNLFSIRDVPLHNKRRRVFDQGFSTKAISSYEPRVKNKVDHLLDTFSKQEGKPINITNYANYFAFDVMGDVIYSKDYNMVENGDGIIEAGGQKLHLENMHGAMKVFGILGTTPWLLRMVAQLNLSGDFTVRDEWCRIAMREKQQRWKKGDIPLDVSSYLMKAREEGDQPLRQNQLSLEQDSILLIVAGSDTTASAIANALYYLIRNPAAYRTLQAQLDAAFPGGETTVTHDKVREVAYLDHVINETLRLKPPVPSGLFRETPPEGLQVDEVHIPGGVIVSVPTWAVQRDERLWGAEPEAFRPERFESVNLTAEAVPFLPFSKGVYGCPGKTLAYMEMRSVLSRIALRFDLAFAPGETGETFETRLMDTFTLTNQPLQLVFNERARK